MRKLNYKHTTSDNSKDRSCTSKVQKNISNPGLADKFRQSLIGTMLFCGLTVGTCSIADAAFSNHRTTVLDKNIFGDYNSVYDTAGIDTDNNINNLKVENIRLYNKNYYRDILNNNIKNNNVYSFNSIITRADTLPSKPIVMTMQEKPDTVNGNTIINSNNSNNSNNNKTNNTKHSKQSKSTFVEHGIASHMGHALHGRRQASGERHNKNEMICAHKYLPFGTRIRVTDKKTGKSVIVRVTDRGPFGPGRVVDLSLAAAKKLGIEKSGITKVKIEKVL